MSYPFGYGLSYTDFTYSQPEVTRTEGGWKVSVKVANTGACAGREAVQIYADSPDIRQGRPVQELVAFAKTGLLAPGESQILTMLIRERNLAWYDASAPGWILEKGKYSLRIGASSRDIRCTASFNVDSRRILEKTHDSLPLQKKINFLSLLSDH